MVFFRQQARPKPESTTPLPSLAQIAGDLLQHAATIPPDDATLVIEERNIWQPESWLIQRCWEALADAGAATEALAVAQLSVTRQPLALFQTLHRLARQTNGNRAAVALVGAALQQARAPLFSASSSSPTQLANQLLLAAATASLLGDVLGSIAALERIDQIDNGWRRIFSTPEDRNLLAEVVARIGPHPLINALIGNALRRFADGGADFLQHVAEHLEPGTPTGRPTAHAKLLLRAVDTLRYGMLTTLHSHRVAAVVLARAGLVNETLQQITVIANILEARRGAGLSARADDQNLLRQVKRPRANSDVDFQVYTLREAVHVLPMSMLTREQRSEIADQLSVLGRRSDGWTAAGAASTLVELGAITLAVEVVQQIEPNDPTRSEGMITLVRSLLAVGDLNIAAEQTGQALVWVRSLQRRNPERALIWGLAEAYIEFGQPLMALELLQQWRAETGIRLRVRSIFGSTFSDDDLRLKRLRLQALLNLRRDAQAGEVDLLLEQLREWAPRLLEGEALISFYADGLLRPLLSAGRTQQAWSLLPQIRAALTSNTGSKHAARVAEICVLLARQMRLESTNRTATSTTATNTTDSRNLLAQFLIDLWQTDAAKGEWQAVHSVEGSLPLLLALEGAQALVTIARRASASSA